MFINSYTDDKGDLFAKYFLIDSSVNDRQWATTDEANERYARTAVGTPLTLMQNKEESLFGDYHPFLKGDAPAKEQIDYAYKYAIGQIVDVTKESGRYKAAYGGPDGVIDNPWFAIVKITDPAVKEELLKPDSKLMPQAVSPGLLHYEGPDKAITNYQIVHLAAVDKGAYGPRAVKWASCNGDALSCLPQLKAASYKERNHICPLEVLSSYVQKSASSDINMSAVNNVTTPGPQTFGTGTVSTSYPDQSQSQSTPTKPTIRIRKKSLLNESEENGQEEQPEGGNGESGQQQQGQDNPQQSQASVQSVQKELQDLRKTYESQANVWKQDKMRREVQDAIPKSLFTDQNGRRFRQKDWEKEVEARVQQGLPIETIREIYQLKVQMLEVPEIQQRKRASSFYNPAPIPKGASSQDSDEDVERKMKLTDLGRMVRGQ